MNSSKLFLAALLVSSTALAGPFPQGADSKEALCQGRSPRFVPKAVVRVQYPDTKGLPIDTAAEIKTQRINVVRELLKRGYFSNYFFNATRDEEDAYRESVQKRGVDSTVNALMSNYTFRFPVSVLEKTFKVHGHLDQQHYGYDYSSMTWKPSLAIGDAEWMWQNYLYRMTTVKETAKESGEVVFQVELDLGLFCQTAIANSDLVSR